PALGRHAPIDLSPGAFRDVGHALVDRVADLLATMRDRKVTGGLSVDEVRALVSRVGAMPDEGGDAAAIVAEASDLLLAHSLYNGHPRFLGYITASPAPIGMLADLLAAAVNPNVGAWALSPVATEIESQTIRWIAELLGYPAGCSGILVSGGNEANFVGIYAALRARFPRDDASGRADGLARATIYASSETHTWIEKAIDMFGLPPDALRSIAVDAERRLDLGDLARRLTGDVAAGRIPVAVVGTAGTVSTGAVDPLPAIATLCRTHGTWFHVDGAYGGFAAMLDDERLVPRDLHGLALADSVAVDPHKWLYAPLEAGCALVRDPALHRAAFSYHPPYYHFGVEATNYVDLGPQNSRGFRALKVWMALRQVGRAGYRQMLGDDIALARALHERLAADPRFEVGTQSLSITTFRYVPGELAGDRSPDAEAYLNRLNREVQARLEKSGELFVSNAVVDGRYLLRSCIVNFRTAMSDIEAIPEIVARHGAAAHAAS
ncbi:MAG TPA: aspartate aminotransferase family protein, partial [Gemmatimonadaceae bacterium]|nr:aspartate aminotransferase family protein [Gemmatimonadaceae bacterium]